MLTLEGIVLLDMNRPKQASESLALATQRGQPNIDLMYHLAQAYSAAGDTEQATAAAQQALALDAGHEPTRQLLAQMAARTAPSDLQRR